MGLNLSSMDVMRLETIGHVDIMMMRSGSRIERIAFLWAFFSARV